MHVSPPTRTGCLCANAGAAKPRARTQTPTERYPFDINLSKNPRWLYVCLSHCLGLAGCIAAGEPRGVRRIKRFRLETNIGGANIHLAVCFSAAVPLRYGMRPAAPRAIPTLSMAPIIAMPMSVPVGSCDRSSRGTYCRAAPTANGAANNCARHSASPGASLCESLRWRYRCRKTNKNQQGHAVLHLRFPFDHRAICHAIPGGEKITFPDHGLAPPNGLGTSNAATVHTAAPITWERCSCR